MSPFGGEPIKPTAGHPFTNIALANAYWSSTTYMALTANAMSLRFTDGRWINGIDPGDASFNNEDDLHQFAVGGPYRVSRCRSAACDRCVSGVGGGSFGSGDDAA